MGLMGLMGVMGVMGLWALEEARTSRRRAVAMAHGGRAASMGRDGTYHPDQW